MSKLLAATAMGLVLAVAAGCAQAPATDTAAAETSAATPARVDNFRLVEAGGKAVELYRMKDASAVVMVMHSAGSADVARLAPELAKLQAAYEGKGVEFLMINSNPKDTREAILADKEKNGITARVVQDDNQLVGEQIGATNVGETFVVDPKTWKIAYHGPLAADAIDAVVSGGEVKVASAPVKGARIDFPARSAKAQAEFARISYSDTIAPLIEEKCVACHQQGGIAPFAFDGYEKVKGFAPMIREAVRTDRMPPWDADAHVGKFKDDKSLSADETKTLIHWIEAGAPRGTGADRLSEVKHVAPEWPLGKPDLIVDIPKFTVPASGIVDYQYPVTANPLKEGRWLKASTAKVSQRQAVHHILSGIIPEGQTKKGMEAWGGSVGGYTVGMESVEQPKGVGSWIPAGGQFAYQMHYTPFGKEVVSAEQIGLYFYKDGEKPDLVMRENALVDQFITIPPNEESHKEIAYFLFPKDAILHTAVVHAHYRGTYSKLEVIDPSGKRETILNVPFYDFNWQRMYEFDKPIPIKAGSKVVATYIYDNSKRNPANPNPNETVVWGDQSFEEMFYTSLRYRWVDETAEKQTNYDQLLLQGRLMGMMDDNLDDKLQKGELRGQFAQLAAAPGAFEMGDANKDGGIDQAELQKVLQMMQQMRRNQPQPAAAATPANKPAGGGQ
ncbi:MAG TPA: redoxin domain-containing protein [Hyphomonadaceae bacterium]|nr:redoxin domain-containing protein [Hyphomonadaceae bacterium]